MMPHRTEYAPACDQPGADPDLWFREDQESMSIARRLCNGCELKDPCLTVAMAFPDEDQWGIWGGETAAARRARRAADPERWPVSVGLLQEFLGTRGERFGDHWAEETPESPGWANRDGKSLRAGEVNWSMVQRREALERMHPEGALQDRVSDLLDRYQDVTELGYGLTGLSGMVTPVNDNEVAA